MSESEEEIWTLDDHSERVKLLCGIVISRLQSIQQSHTEKFGKMNENVKTHLRTSPRTLASMKNEELVDIIVSLQDSVRTSLSECADDCRQILGCINGCNEIISKHCTEICSLHETSIAEAKASPPAPAPVLVDPLSETLSSLDQKLADLTDLHTTLQGLHTTISTLPSPQPPPTIELDYTKVTFPPLDYSKLKFPAQTTSPPPTHPPPTNSNIRKQIIRSSNVLQKKNNIMIYGLKVENCSAKDRVVKMFKECGVNGIRLAADNVISAHIVGSENPAIRVVMSNQFIVGEVLSVAQQLKNSNYSHVYLSKDRTPEERERHRKCVAEMKKKRHDSPDRRWAIVGGIVIDKGEFVK